MSRNTRILDYDGFPHDADTGERTIGDNERPGHWIDDLPTVPVEGIKLIASPSDMVMGPDGKWTRRDEYERRRRRMA